MEALGIWLIKVVINIRTAITQVGLPYFNRTNPQQGSKQARDSILKLLSGMNGDVQPLNFRSELKLSGDKDPYYAAAPAWSTLSGGNNPTHTSTPAQICEWLLDAIKCVPSLRVTPPPPPPPPPLLPPPPPHYHYLYQVCGLLIACNASTSAKATAGMHEGRCRRVKGTVTAM